MSNSSWGQPRGGADEKMAKLRRGSRAVNSRRESGGAKWGRVWVASEHRDAVFRGTGRSDQFLCISPARARDAEEYECEPSNREIALSGTRKRGSKSG